MKYLIYALFFLILATSAFALGSIPTTELTSTPLYGVEVLTVNFYCTATGGDGLLTYILNFDDGSQIQSHSPITATHSYPLGVHNPSCIVIDADWDFNIDEDTITVRSGGNGNGGSEYPNSSFSAYPTSGYSPLAVNLVCNGTGSDTPLRYELYFGDDSQPMYSNHPIITAHVYLIPGTYHPRCIITDDDGDVSEDDENINITVLLNDTNPQVQCTASQYIGYAPLTVSFTPFIIGGDAPYAFLWSIGGSQSTQAIPSYTFTQPGTYSAILNLTDHDGDKASCFSTITVMQGNDTDDTIPTVNCSLTPGQGQSPLTVNFSSSVSGGNAPYGYLWNFGDNSSASMQQDPRHIYTKANTYHPSLLVTDIDGDVANCTSSLAVTVTHGKAALLTLNASPARIPADGHSTSAIRMTLTDIHLNPISGAMMHLYFYGSGNLSNVTDNHDGSYSAVFTSSTVPRFNNITAQYLFLNAHIIVETYNQTGNQSGNQTGNLTGYFIAVPEKGPAPLDVKFKAAVSGPGIMTYSWDFDASNGLQPDMAGRTASHTYNQTGNYTVTLRILSDNGKTGYLILTKVIQVLPQANFTPTPNPERNITEEDLIIESVSLLPDEHITDYVDLAIKFRNTGDIDLHDLELAVSVPELGIKRVLKVGTLKKGKAQIKAVSLDIPNVSPGKYTLRVQLYNDITKRTMHRDLFID